MPTYVTPEHLIEQRAIADKLELAWRCTVVMRPETFDKIDALAWRNGRVVAVIELRRRHGALRDCYPTTALIDVHKVHALDEAAMEHHGCASLYVIQFDDVLVSLTIDGRVRACPRKTLGRKDRHDPHNVNPAFVVPVEWLRPVRSPEPSYETPGDFQWSGVADRLRSIDDFHARIETTDEYRDFVAALDAIHWSDPHDDHD